MAVNNNDKFNGTAYVARIRESKDNISVHKQADLLHAVVYEEPTESFDYMQLKALVE